MGRREDGLARTASSLDDPRVQITLMTAVALLGRRSMFRGEPWSASLLTTAVVVGLRFASRTLARRSWSSPRANG